MKRYLFYILIMLLALPAAFSCSSLMPEKEGDNRLVITGTVSDFDTDKPIKGIKVSLTARIQGDSNGKPLHEINVYTNNHGAYTIDLTCTPVPLTCSIEAADRDKVYKNSVNNVEVTWTGTAFDSFSNMFIVNDCNFKLEKN